MIDTIYILCFEREMTFSISQQLRMAGLIDTQDIYCVLRERSNFFYSQQVRVARLIDTQYIYYVLRERSHFPIPNN